MHAWAAPDLPRLAGHGPPVYVHDTAAALVCPAAVQSTVRIYVCGITPYDATHLGHAATYVAFDVLNRALRDRGHDVRYVQNVTDVDDPLLERAGETGRDWQGLVAEQIGLFRDDMAWLRVIPPDRFVGVVESMPLVADFVDRLRTAGATYDVDGDLYFPVKADSRFGAISHLDRADMLALFAERGGDPDRPGKKDPLDCVLWQQARSGEPAWDGAVGRGRPGWHVECAAIALEFLGDGLDVQGGGSDLLFPHHEMSAAEAHVATGTRPFARAYVHSGMVGLDGEKMSKSKGNLIFVSGLRSDQVEAPAVRLGLLADHYRTDRDWTPEMLSSAQARLGRWRRAVEAPAGPAALGLLADVRQHLANDLDTPAALAAVDHWADETLTLGGSDAAAPALVRDMVDALLGVDLDPR